MNFMIKSTYCLPSLILEFLITDVVIIHPNRELSLSETTKGLNLTLPKANYFTFSQENISSDEIRQSTKTSITGNISLLCFTSGS